MAGETDELVENRLFSYRSSSRRTEPHRLEYSVICVLSERGAVCLYAQPHAPMVLTILVESEGLWIDQ